MNRSLRVAALATMLIASTTIATAGAAEAEVAAQSSVGVVDTSRGFWYLRDGASGETTSFYYGNPGDVPFMGDWDCDGIDTPGLYRQSDGYVYLRNSNTQGIADIRFFFGNPGDIPLAGDFDGDGCDTVSLFRPSDGHFYVIDELGSDDQGLGAATLDFAYGDPSDVPFTGDFNGDGIDTFGMRRLATGQVYLSNVLGSSIADMTFPFGDPGDVVLAGRWSVDALSDTVALFRPSNTTFYFGADNAGGPAGASVFYGARRMVPISGAFGSLPGGGDAPRNEPHLVSEFTTYHPAGQSRNINIDLIADMTDGAVVEPGATFSLNDWVGERTEAKGFVRAGAIIGGVVYCCDSPINVGGGTSQFATTLYNAIFFGGYEDIAHRPHSLYFSRYPVAREATLGYPGPDVVFRNDTAYPVTIRTSHTATSITVQMIGDNEGRSVDTWTVGSVSSSAGGTATVYRTIRYANGSTSTQSWTHTYRVPIAEDEPPPPPPPDPDPDPPGPVPS